MKCHGASINRPKIVEIPKKRYIAFFLKKKLRLLSQTAATRKSCKNQAKIGLDWFCAVSSPYCHVLSIFKRQASLKSSLIEVVFGENMHIPV